MSALNVYDVSHETGFKFFHRCVTSNMKVIKSQSETNLSYFPKGSFGKKVWCNRGYGDLKKGTLQSDNGDVHENVTEK